MRIKKSDLLFLLLFVPLSFKVAPLGIAGAKVFHLTSLLFMPLIKRSSLANKFFLFFLFSTLVTIFHQTFLSGVDGYYVVRHFFWIYCFLVGASVARIFSSEDLISAFIFSSCVIASLVFLKNLVYFDVIASMYMSGGAHPRSPWNFFNPGYNVNSEVTWLVVFALLSWSLSENKKYVFWFLSFSVVNALIAKVNGAVLLVFLYFSISIFVRFRVELRFVGLTLSILSFAVVLLGLSYEFYEELGSGRLELWFVAAEEIKKFSFLEIMFGRGIGSLADFGYFEDLSLLDFHNIFIDIFYEMGALGITVYIVFILFPALRVALSRSSSVDRLHQSLGVAVLLVLFNGLFTPRPLDPLFAFIVGSFLAASQRHALARAGNGS